MARIAHGHWAYDSIGGGLIASAYTHIPVRGTLHGDMLYVCLQIVQLRFNEAMCPHVATPQHSVHRRRTSSPAGGQSLMADTPVPANIASSSGVPVIAAMGEAAV